MYYVSLKQFEGPLDLLLHLITRAKVDIKDIFVSEITEQYLASMGSVDELDMDTASEFLTMAATLLEIKSRALLPRPPEPAEDGEETPEQTLIRRLEEYKLYKESAGRMKEFEQAAMQVFSKLPEEYPLPPQETELVGLTLQWAGARAGAYSGAADAERRAGACIPLHHARPLYHRAMRVQSDGAAEKRAGAVYGYAVRRGDAGRDRFVFHGDARIAQAGAAACPTGACV